MINIVVEFKKRAIASFIGLSKRAVLSYVNYSKKASLVFQTGLFFLFKQNSDNFTVSDTNSNSAGKNVSDSFQLSDTATRQVDFDRKPVDTAQVGENLARTVQFNRSFTDGYTIGDIYTDQVQFNRSPVSAASFGDGIDYFQISKNITDNLSVTDDTNGALIDDDQVATVTKVRGDGFQTLDLLTASTSKVLQNTFQLTESLDSSVIKVLSDTYNIGDEFSSSFSKVETDGTALTDSLTTLNVFNRSPTSSAGFSDSIDSFETTKGVTDTLNLSEVISNSVTKLLLDNFVVDDVLDRSVQFRRTPLDGSQLTDTDVIDYSKVVSDGVQLGDSRTISVGYYRSLIDQLNVTDDVNGAAVGDDQLLEVFKVKNNTTNISETLVSDTIKAPTSQASFSDGGNAYFQNYAGNYFGADYVGGSRAFT